MKKNTWKRNVLLASLLVATAAGGCAQDIGDIDRTQPNKIKKSDLTSGVWYMVQKIAHEDSFTEEYSGNEGSTATTQKVIFVAEENYLIAYRAYATLPGSDNVTLNMYGPDSYEELYSADYKQGIEAMYPIESHFDVQRQYDTATGEQSNVIVENTSDRNWWEREYIRVNWGGNPLVNIDMMMDIYDDLTTMPKYSHDYDLNADGSDPNAPYFERDKDGKLVYFDTPTTYVYEPWWYSCIYGEYRYATHYFFGTCASTEIRIVTGFLRDNGERKFEPVEYTQQDMARFGFFNTERRVYDPYYGFMDSAVKYFANIHNIWEDTYNDDGSIKPISERTVKTKPYYVRNLPNEEYLEKAAHDSIEIWNKTFKKAVRVIQGKVDKPTELTDALIANDKDVFVMCHIPVNSAKGDNNEICGPDGYAPREADPRYDTLWVVNQHLDNGLLGYCPSFDDPVTGEALAAVAHVYTEGMNMYAARIIDYVKYLNGDMTDDEVLSNAYRVETAKERTGQFIDLQFASQIAKTKDIEKINKARTRSTDRKVKREMFLRSPEMYNYTKTDSIIKKAYNDGLLAEVGSEDINRHFSKMFNMSDPTKLNDNIKEEASIYGITSPILRKLQRQNRIKLSNLGYCFNDNMNAKMPEYATIAREFVGRHDYDNIARELRGRVFVGTAVHEMGHGFGLYHNFASSADALNYRDRFWDLRADENFNKDITNPNELAKLYDYTDKQLGAIPKTGDPTEDAIGDEEAKKGSMMMQMMTSIMDYTSYYDDWGGVGRYDLAAIIYAYSKGTDIVKGESAALCKAKGGEVVSNGCKRVVSGIVEVFDDDHRLKDLGVFGEILSHKDTTGAVSAKITYDADGTGKLVEKTLYSTFDDPTTIGQPYGELVHYHDMARLFPNNNLGNGTPAFITARKYARLEDYQVSRAKDGENAMVRVPYFFCSNDNEGQLASCKMFDYGADMYEQVMDTINNYEDYYWFTNYARGRSYWDAFMVSYYNYASFLDLTDRFQNAYMQSDVLDDIIEDNNLQLMSRVQDAASVASINFLAKVTATPEYGVFCKRKDDNSLYPLSPDAKASAETSEFYRRAICGKNPEYYYIKPGQGRRHYQKYDVNYGYDYQDKEYETMHIYTGSFAAMALLDNEANVIADSGDIGAYNFGMYNVYDVEITKLFNAILAEDYRGISPVLDLSKNEVITVNGEEIRTGTLRYKPLVYANWWNKDGSYYSYDPLSWQSEDAAEEYFDDDSLLTVENDTSHTQKYFMGAYGMIFTGESWKSSFYDQLNIWRAGSGEAITAGTGYETISFTSPSDSGDVYSANYIDCSKADLSNLPSVCIANGLNYKGATGGALLIDHANKLSVKMSNAYSDYITKYRNLTPAQIANDDSEEYQDMLNSYYEYRMYESQTDIALRDINMIRGFYQYFGSLF